MCESELVQRGTNSINQLTTVQTFNSASGNAGGGITYSSRFARSIASDPRKNLNISSVRICQWVASYKLHQMPLCQSDSSFRSIKFP